MKLKFKSTAFALIALSMTFSAQAHDPKEHMKGAESPNCATMKDMDHSKMDMNDPVMQAMMQQCMKEMHSGDKSHSMSHEDTSTDAHMKGSEQQHSEHKN